MAQGLVTHAYLEDIADAIREKLGTQDTYTPSQMASAVMQIPTGEVEIVPWATGTDEQLAAMIQAAHNGDIDLQTDGGWAVGDVRTISVGSFTDGAGTTHAQQDIDIAISSFDDYENCGCVMQFDFKDALANGIRINPTNTNEGGFGASEMKTTTLPALVNALPTWLKNALVEFSCLATAGNTSTTLVTVTGNKLALRSEKETMNNTNYSGASEGLLVSYYSNSNNREKKKGHSGSEDLWMLRSAVKAGVTYGFVGINSRGSTGNYPANNAYCVAPFGCL